METKYLYVFSDDAQYCFQLLQSIPRTYRFDLSIKQATGKERKGLFSLVKFSLIFLGIRALIEDVQKQVAKSEAEVNEVYEKYNCKNV